jgi:hypothetical protein
MAIKYLSGKRLQGTAAERTSLNLSAPPATSWKELTRSVAITSETHTITTPTFAAKDNLKVLIYGSGADNSGVRPRIQFNSDTGSNYSYRESNNGNTDATGEDTTSIYISEADCESAFSAVLDITNIANKEKLVITDSGRTANDSAGTAPSRYEGVGKWANTSNQITSISMIAYTTTAQGFSAGWEIVVLGCDNDEADSGTNFWQELSSVELSSAADTISSGTITAKKYLMVQYKIIADGTLDNVGIQFNNDTGNNYAYRQSTDGAADGTTTSGSIIRFRSGGAVSNNFFGTLNIINNSSTVKLVISDQIRDNTAGAGNAPSRAENVGKWANTSNQITEIDLIQDGSGSFAAGTTLKVWGSD